jgi:hypothetical protein
MPHCVPDPDRGNRVGALLRIVVVTLSQGRREKPNPVMCRLVACASLVVGFVEAFGALMLVRGAAPESDGE